MKKSSKILLVVAVSAIIVTGLAIAISQELRTLSSNFGGLTPNFGDLEESDRQATFPFNFTELPEYFVAGLYLEGSGYAGQPHLIGIWVGHNRLDNSVWLASGDYTLSIKNGSYSEPIISNSFENLTNTVPFEDKDHSWISPSTIGVYDFVLSLTNLIWIMATEYTITATYGTATIQNLGGSISPSGAVTVLKGDDQQFLITADSGYAIEDVLVNNVSEGPISNYLFENVQANHTIHAIFSELLAEMGAYVYDEFPPVGYLEDGGNVLFDGETNNSYSPGADVSFSCDITVTENTVLQISYYLKAERVGGGDAYTVELQKTIVGTWDTGTPIQISDTFSAPAYGEWSITLWLTNVVIP